jgi:F-type H+-transporting ATPase subunit c
MMMLAALFTIAAPMFAQGQGGGAGSSPVIPIALAMGLASGLCGLGQGKAIGSAMEGIARNPGAGGAIRVLLLIGLAFIESLALFTFVVVSK